MAEVESEYANKTKKGIWGWMFFDWAAQPFFTVVTTFIFGPYVVSRMVDDPVQGQAAWGYAVAIGGLIIGFLSPVLGSISDKTGPRKPWIAFFASIKIIALFLLWFSAPGSDLIWVLILFIIATVCAEFSIVFNDSMLPSLSSKKDVGKISNIAWGMGYTGGMIVLIFVLLFLAADPESGKTIIGQTPLFGLDPALGEPDRFTAPLSGMWYFIFLMPMFLFTPDMKSNGIKLKDAVGEGIAELKDTIFELKNRAGLLKFFIARMIYQDGVNALLALGGTFAAGMFLWGTTELGIYGILLNVVAIPSCIIAGKLDTTLGSKAVVLSSLIMLIAATVGVASTGKDYTMFGLLQFEPTAAEGLFSTPAEKFYILYGCLIGIAFGPVQASSRSYLARSIAVEESGKFYGLYSLSGRATSFFAPFIVATVTAVSGSAHLGMSILVFFFAIGFYILLTTPYPAEQVDE